MWPDQNTVTATCGGFQSSGTDGSGLLESTFSLIQICMRKKSVGG
jgi:hypothetical protein